MLQEVWLFSPPACFNKADKIIPCTFFSYFPFIIMQQVYFGVPRHAPGARLRIIDMKCCYKSIKGHAEANTTMLGKTLSTANLELRPVSSSINRLHQDQEQRHLSVWLLSCLTDFQFLHRFPWAAVAPRLCSLHVKVFLEELLSPLMYLLECECMTVFYNNLHSKIWKVHPSMRYSLWTYVNHL